MTRDELSKMQAMTDAMDELALRLRMKELEAALADADRILAARQPPDVEGDISICRRRIRDALMWGGK